MFFFQKRIISFRRRREGRSFVRRPRFDSRSRSRFHQIRKTTRKVWFGLLKSAFFSCLFIGPFYLFFETAQFCYFENLGLTRSPNFFFFFWWGNCDNFGFNFFPKIILRCSTKNVRFCPINFFKPKQLFWCTFYVLVRDIRWSEIVTKNLVEAIFHPNSFYWKFDIFH
jgi:hypothetical protein